MALLRRKSARRLKEMSYRDQCIVVGQIAQWINKTGADSESLMAAEEHFGYNMYVIIDAIHVIEKAALNRSRFIMDKAGQKNKG